MISAYSFWLGAVKVLAEHGFGLPGVPPTPPPKNEQKWAFSRKSRVGTHPPLKKEYLLDVRMNTAREDTHIEKERIYLLKKSYL